MVRKLMLIVLASAAMVAARAGADEPKKPDPAAMMAAMEKAAKVGEWHKKLNPMVGSFEFTMKFWMDPSMPAGESKGTTESKWVMGERYLRQDVRSEFGGMPFVGVGLIGYDNLKKKYVSTWIDNMGTGISYSTGEVDSTGKIFTFTGEEIDPLTEQKIATKDVTTLGEDGNYKSEYYKVIGGKDVKAMEIHYTKKK